MRKLSKESLPDNRVKHCNENKRKKELHRVEKRRRAQFYKIIAFDAVKSPFHKHVGYEGQLVRSAVFYVYQWHLRWELAGCSKGNARWTTIRQSQCGIWSSDSVPLQWLTGCEKRNKLISKTRVCMFMKGAIRPFSHCLLRLKGKAPLWKLLPTFYTSFEKNLLFYSGL